VYTSVHIEEFECVARDTKLGKEEITKDIPNVGEEALKDLDDAGVVRIGAEVKPGDILVGKITPKGESQLSPEEKLLRAIFGEKAGDVRDSSLKVPPGVSGIVINARIFSRKGTDKDERAKSIEDTERLKLERVREEEMKILRDSFFRKIKRVLGGKTTAGKLVDDKGKVLLNKGTVLNDSELEQVPQKYWGEIPVEETADEVRQLLSDLETMLKGREEHFADKIDRLSRGDELPPGVIKMVKVYVAIKRKLQVGDKMAGRHGNKGVVSRILPEEDMPYLEDGRPVDIVLNPLGVPSRMNVGQILETHLGWGARELGRQIDIAIEDKFGPEKLRQRMLEMNEQDPKFQKVVKALPEPELNLLAKKLRRGLFMGTPVFDGAQEITIKQMLERSGRSSSG
jgi:DNA-directed RNA polymerase subunit beta